MFLIPVRVGAVQRSSFIFPDHAVELSVYGNSDLSGNSEFLRLERSKVELNGLVGETNPNTTSTTNELA